MPVIHVQSICKNFGSLEAVKDLSFEVKEGEIFGFWAKMDLVKVRLLECCFL